MSRIHRWNRSASAVEYKDVNLPDPYQLQIYHRQRQPSKLNLHNICLLGFILTPFIKIIIILAFHILQKSFMCFSESIYRVYDIYLIYM